MLLRHLFDGKQYRYRLNGGGPGQKNCKASLAYLIKATAEESEDQIEVRVEGEWVPLTTVITAFLINCVHSLGWDVCDDGEGEQIILYTGYTTGKDAKIIPMENRRAITD